MGFLDNIKKDLKDFSTVPGKNIVETNDFIEVNLNLAGIEKENIDLNVTDSKISVKAEYEGRLIRRTVRFPKKVIPEESEAKFENGILCIVAPKQDRTDFKKTYYEQENSGDLNESWNDEVIETDELILIRVNLAGIIKENIDVNITNNVITLTAINKSGKSIKRKISVNQNIMPEEAKVEINNGLLTLNIPKTVKSSKNINKSEIELTNPIKNNNLISYKKKENSQIDQKEKIDLLIVELKSSSSKERNNAVFRLVREGESAFKKVLEASKSDNEVIRRKSCDYFGMKGDPRGIEPLIQLLKDPNKHVRSRAANALISIGDKQALKSLITASKDIDPKVHKYASLAIIKINDDEMIIPFLVDALNDNDKEIRRAAAKALCNIKDERIVLPLIEALKDSDFKVKLFSVEALGNIGDQKAVEPLEELKIIPESEIKRLILGYEEERTLKSAAENSLRKLMISKKREINKKKYKYNEALNTLESLDQIEKNTESKEMIYSLLIYNCDISKTVTTIRRLGDPAIEYVIFASEDVSDENIRKNACDVLGQIPKISLVNPLLNALKDPSDLVKLHAAQAINNFSPYLNTLNNVSDNIVEPLIKALESSNEEFQDVISIIISNIGYNAVEPLIRALDSPNEDVRAYASSILGIIGDDRAVESLIKAAIEPHVCSVPTAHPNDPEWNIQFLAAQALGEIRDDRAVEPLLRLLTDSDDTNIRIVAALGLGNIGNFKSTRYLMIACDDNSHIVRLAAINALGIIGDPRACSELVNSALWDINDNGIAAIDSLMKIGNEDAQYALEFIVSNPNYQSNIRKTAADALLKLENGDIYTLT